MTEARAVINPDGVLKYWKPGSTRAKTIQAEDLQAARVRLVQHVTDALSDPFNEHGDSLRIEVIDPETGTGVLIVSADGTVAREEQPEAETPEESEVEGHQADEPEAVEETVAEQPADEPEAIEETVAEPVQRPAAPEEEAPAPFTSRREMRATTLAQAFSETEKERPDGPAVEGWQGIVNQISNGVVKLAPGAKERKRRDARTAVQRGLDSHKTVAFLNLKGGASKTTNCYLVSAIFGTARGGSVLAWDANDNKGTLGDRSLQANHDRTAQELLGDLERFSTGKHEHELVNYMRPQGELHFDVLSSQNTASTSAVIDGEGFNAMHATLRRFYRMMFVDTGNAPSSSTWTAAVEAADLVVICASNKEDQVKVAASTIDTLEAEGYGEKIANAVFLVSNPQNVNRERLARMEKLFGGRVRAMQVIPFDRHLDDGSRIEWHSLSEETKDAYLYAAQAITDGL